MSVPKVLLLSCTPPGPQGVGGIILRDLCLFYPRDKWCGFFPWPEDQPLPFADDLTGAAHISVPVRFDKLPPHKFGKLGKYVAWKINQRNFRHHIDCLINEAVQFGRIHRVDKVWGVLDAPTSIAMAAPVAKALGVPLVTTVWDDVRHLAESLALDRLTSQQMIARCGAAIRQSEKCAVICTAMKDGYEQEFKTQCIVLRHGLTEENLIAVKSMPTEEEYFLIGFAGTMNAPDAFVAFWKALDQVRWTIAGRRVILRVLGPRFDLRSQGPAHVEFMGWRSLDETVQLLSETDMTYLPQPFSERYRHMATLSFPTKFTTYLAASCPVFLHAPEYGSLAHYFREKPFGFWCDSLAVDDIAQKLTQIVVDRKAYAMAAEQGRAVLLQDFSQDVFRANFARFLGVDVSSLNFVSAREVVVT